MAATRPSSPLNAARMIEHANTGIPASPLCLIEDLGSVLVPSILGQLEVREQKVMRDYSLFSARGAQSRVAFDSASPSIGDSIAGTLIAAIATERESTPTTFCDRVFCRI